MPKNIRLLTDKPTDLPLKSTQDRYERKKRQLDKEDDEPVIKKQFTFIIVSNSTLAEIFQKIADQQLARKPAIRVIVKTKIPSLALAEEITTKKEPEKKKLIFLDFYKTAPTFKENTELSNALTSNGFEFRVTKHKVQEDLVYEATKWLYSYLDAI